MHEAEELFDEEGIALGLRDDPLAQRGRDRRRRPEEMLELDPSEVVRLL
jgi:hypothetical protein